MGFSATCRASTVVQFRHGIHGPRRIQRMVVRMAINHQELPGGRQFVVALLVFEIPQIPDELVPNFRECEVSHADQRICHSLYI